MTRVLIADDHLLFREGLRKLLEVEGLDVVAEASTGPETVDRARDTQPDVVLLDVSMPGRGGVEVVQTLKRQRPEMRILMLTAHPEDHFAVRCLRSGADGYLTKDRAADELIRAIERVRQGGKYITTSLAEQLAISLQEGVETPHESLSDREFQVMNRIAQGETVSEIADEMHLSVKTISTYRSRVLRKLGLRNNAEIMLYAIRENLV